MKYAIYAKGFKKPIKVWNEETQTWASAIYNTIEEATKKLGKFDNKEIYDILPCVEELVHDKIDEIFLELQDIHNITDGGIDPLDGLKLEEIEEALAELIERVINYQKGGI